MTDIDEHVRRRMIQAASAGARVGLGRGRVVVMATFAEHMTESPSPAAAGVEPSGEPPRR